jgi:hypothetical protein
LEESERSGMAVLEVKIPTGYFVLQSRLDNYVLSGYVPTLRRAKYFSDKVVFYFDYVSALFQNSRLPFDLEGNACVRLLV